MIKQNTSPQHQKTYREYVAEARARKVKNCQCHRLVYICSVCGKIHGSEVKKHPKILNVIDKNPDF
jgi:hypothetical protein